MNEIDLGFYKDRRGNIFILLNKFRAFFTEYCTIISNITTDKPFIITEGDFNRDFTPHFVKIGMMINNKEVVHVGKKVLQGEADVVTVYRNGYFETFEKKDFDYIYLSPHYEDHPSLKKFTPPQFYENEKNKNRIEKIGEFVFLEKEYVTYAESESCGLLECYNEVKYETCLKEDFLYLFSNDWEEINGNDL